MTAASIIEIDHITKVYKMGDVQVTALDDVSLDVHEGEFLAIMGPSGSGKSTLMNILGCLDRPTSGTYLLAGEDVSRMNREQLAHIRNQKIGFIFQSYNLLAQATAIQNVLMPIVYRRNGHISTRDRMELAHDALVSVGLADRDKHKPTEMSGGQQQRVAIARALINSPALILADEPTGNLDSHSGLEIMTILQNLNAQERTIVMITHDARNAELAGRVIHLQDGKIEEDNHHLAVPARESVGEFNMKLSEVLRIAGEGIARNKLRALLTMLGVIIGVAAVIIMIAISAGTEATISDNIKNLGTNLLFVTQSMGPQQAPSRTSGTSSTFLTYDDAKAISDSITGISGVVVERDISELVKYGSTSVDSVSVIGTTPSYPQVRDVTQASGRFVTQADIDNSAKVVVLGYTTAQTLFGNADPVGEKIYVGDVRLTVVGVMAKKGVVGNTDYDSRIYIPLTLVFEKFTFSPFARVQGDQVGTILVQVTNLNNMDKVITQIQILLAKRHETTVASLPFSVRTQEDIIATQESTTAAFRTLLAWVAGVSLVVGGIGIMNIMLVSVTERTREIGIRQATGATPGDVRGQFLTEALLLSLTGGLIGVIVGVGGAWLFEKIGDMRTVVVPSSILLAFVSAALVGIFFGFYPANKAAQLDPIEALRHE